MPGAAIPNPGVNPRKPIFFCFVDASETVFGPEHLRQETQTDSLPIFDYHLEHEEDHSAFLTIEVLNPKMGLLAFEKLYCWQSKYDPITDTIRPMFFGRMAGSPSNILGEVIELHFVGISEDFDEQKQRLAETLKIAPGYDPLALDQKRRDDPDAVREGWGLLWHIDRLGGAVSLTDPILADPESDGGGVVVFRKRDVFYDSVRIEIAQSPPAAIRVNADVQWTQKAVGVIGNIGNLDLYSFTGGSLISGWPKPTTNLGGGWSVKTSLAYDLSGLDTAQVSQTHYHYQNPEKKHHIGDTMTVDIQMAKPTAALGYEYVIHQKTQSGYISEDPDERDIQPATSSTTSLWVGLWHVITSLTLQYRAERSRSEEVAFTLFADLQALGPKQDLHPRQNFPTEEQITLSGGDVGAPLVEVHNWLGLSDVEVKTGTIMFTNYPLGTLADSYQVAKTDGRIGVDQPDFSVVPGDETVDGTLTWISLGTSFSGTARNWSEGTFFRAGDLLRPDIDDFSTWHDLVPSVINGSEVSELTMIVAPNGALYMCTLGGTTGTVQPSFPASYGAVVVDFDVEWTCIGLRRPDGNVYFQCITPTGGVTNIDYLPNFDITIGGLTSDGSLTWKCLGEAQDFAPVPLVDVARRSFLPTARGIRFLEYLIMLARAHLRQQARAVTISWETFHDLVLDLSCRQAATVFDDRIPGGTATGKITKYSMRGNGDSGVFLGAVEIKPAIGNDGEIADVIGTPLYVEAGTIEDAPVGGAIAALQADVGYSVPVDRPDGDFIFPLTREQVLISERIRGSLEDQLSAVIEGVLVARAIAQLEVQREAAQTPAGYAAAQLLIAQLSKFTVEALLAKTRNGRRYELQLKPADGGPINERFDLAMTLLKIPKQIDLSAPPLS